MMTEFNQVSRLDQIERVVAANAQQIAANAEAIDKLTLKTDANAEAINNLTLKTDANVEAIDSLTRKTSANAEALSNLMLLARESRSKMAHLPEWTEQVTLATVESRQFRQRAEEENRKFQQFMAESNQRFEILLQEIRFLTNRQNGSDPK
jgi:peptidoglycan hydrolase CwlO-like protein